MTYTQDSNKMNSPKQYQLSAIRALREKGLDPDVICGITKTVRQLGREELDHYLTRFLDATKNIPLPILLTWIQGNDAQPRQSLRKVQATLISTPVTLSEDLCGESSGTSHDSTCKKRRRAVSRYDGEAQSDSTANEVVSYTTEHCRLVGCNKTYVREKWFMNHFQSKHQGVRPNQMQCCGHDYRSQGIRLFAQHIWQHHRFEQPRNVQVDHRVSSLDEVCQTSRTLAALLPAPATLTPSLMVQQCEYPTTARMQGHIDAYNGAVVPTGVQQLQRSLDTPNDYVYQRDSTESLFPRALSMMLGYGAELHEPEVMPCESFDTCGSTYTRMGFDPCQGSEDVQSEKVREETPPLS